MKPQNNVVLISLIHASLAPHPEGLRHSSKAFQTFPSQPCLHRLFQLLPLPPGNTQPTPHNPVLPTQIISAVSLSTPYKSREPASFQRPPARALTCSSGHAPRHPPKPHPSQGPQPRPLQVFLSLPSQSSEVLLWTVICVSAFVRSRSPSPLQSLQLCPSLASPEAPRLRLTHSPLLKGPFSPAHPSPPQLRPSPGLQSRPSQGLQFSPPRPSQPRPSRDSLGPAPRGAPLAGLPRPRPSWCSPNSSVLST